MRHPSLTVTYKDAWHHLYVTNFNEIILQQFEVVQSQIHLLLIDL